MEALREYILRIVASGILCACIAAIFPGTCGITTVIKMLVGIFLAFTVISPIVKLDFDYFLNEGMQMDRMGSEISQEGIQAAEEAYRLGIQSRTEAYILDKATVLAPGLTVEVTLSEEDIAVPCGAILSGEVSPYAKSTLQNILETELNIPKEAQIWTG